MHTTACASCIEIGTKKLVPHAYSVSQGQEQEYICMCRSKRLLSVHTLQCQTKHIQSLLLVSNDV
jgi:hypothetical protein